MLFSLVISIATSSQAQLLQTGLYCAAGSKTNLFQTACCSQAACQFSLCQWSEACLLLPSASQLAEQCCGKKNSHLF